MVSRRDGKRLGQREARADSGTWPSRVDAAAHRGGDRCAPRDGERVPASSGDRDPAPSSVGEGAPKTGQTDVDRLRAGKTGHRDVHRSGGLAARARAQPAGERLRALLRVDRDCGRAGSQCDGDLAGPGRRPRLCVRLCERAALREEASRDEAARVTPRDHHGARRGGPSRLRRRPDGAASRDGQVPPHSALRLHARLQPQERATISLEVEQSHVGRAPRARLPLPRRRSAPHGARQSQGRRPRARRLRSGDESALP